MPATEPYSKQQSRNHLLEPTATPRLFSAQARQLPAQIVAANPIAGVARSYKNRQACTRQTLYERAMPATEPYSKQQSRDSPLEPTAKPQSPLRANSKAPISS